MRVFACLTVFIGLLLVAGNVTADDSVPSDSQIKAREFFNYFIHRFADNAEPVGVQTVADCISLYDGLLNKRSQNLSDEEQYDLLGSLVGWQLVAANKVSDGQQLPDSRINLLINEKAEMSKIVAMADEVKLKCHAVEMRAHNAAIAKERAAK